ncbi:MAG TPA: RNA 2',3'-cyclic phosphodiesterase [Candidatus Dormibacteraeota bacterium]|jgi:2'-5' RNA ligase
MSRWRLFVAAALTEPIRTALAEAIGQLRVLAPCVSPSQVDAIHLTLHFLGQVESGRVSQIADGVGRAIIPFPAFELRVSGVGVFPAPSRPRVLWAGVAGPGRTELIALQGAMQLALRSAGIELENRVYAPHLTLGRVRREPRARERASLAEWMHRWQDVQFGALPIDAISLMRSELSVRPPRYTRLESFPLQ